jgi:hypothetical protein
MNTLERQNHLSHRDSPLDSPHITSSLSSSSNYLMSVVSVCGEMPSHKADFAHTRPDRERRAESSYGPLISRKTPIELTMPSYPAARQAHKCSECCLRVPASVSVNSPRRPTSRLQDEDE